MATEILMPRLTDTMLQGVISHWYKKEGESVLEDEPLFMVETDKANVEVNASAAGVLLKIFCGEGESVDVGARVAIIGASGEDIQSLLTSARPAAAEVREEPARGPEGPPMRIKASPAAKRRAKSENVDLAKVIGTGEGGLITEKDVVEHLEKEKKGAADSLKAYGPEEMIPLEGIRKVMTEKMALSLEIPQVTTVAESDVSVLLQLSKERSITITSFVIRAVVEGLRDYPLMNASLAGEKVILKKYHNIGVSVASPRGLIVPVIHNAEKKDIHQITEDLSDLAQKARENRLLREEISGGTFTVTNSGVFGSLFFTPRIHPPESAILGLGKIMKQPVVIGEEVAIRSMMYLCLSYDHRIIDGETAVKFLQEVKKNLESPQGLLKRSEN